MVTVVRLEPLGTEGVVIEPQIIETEGRLSPLLAYAIVLLDTILLGGVARVPSCVCSL